MQPIRSTLSSRLRRDLPPTAPLPAVLQTIACRWWPFGYLERCRERYGDRFTVYPIDMPPLVFLANPQDIRAVLTAPPDVLHPGAGAAVIAPLVGKSAFVLREEDEHMAARRTITPAFHQMVVQDHADMITSLTQREVPFWPLDTAFPVYPHIYALILRVVLKTIFSGDDQLSQRLHARLLDMLAVAASIVLQEPRLRYLPGWHATWKRFVVQRAEVDKVIFALIGLRRRDDDDRGDLLSMLIDGRNPDDSHMSDQQVRDHVMATIVAGAETTTAELAWSFQLLAHNPGVQDRLIEEIDNGAVDHYLAATVQETLRHKPTFLFTIPRAVVKPIEIAGRTYHPPAHLVGCTYLMHHDPTLYPDPHTFRPERFLGTAQSAGAWLPWGAGHKRCLGRHLALLMTKTVLRETLSTRLVLPASRKIEHPRWRSAILVPHAGSRIILRKRQCRRRSTPKGEAAPQAQTGVSNGA